MLGTLHFTKASLWTDSSLGPLWSVHPFIEHTPLLNAGHYGSKPKPDELPTLEDLPALSVLWLLFLNQRLPLKLSFLLSNITMMVSLSAIKAEELESDCQGWNLGSETLHYVAMGKFFPSLPHPPHLYSKDNNTYQLDLSE